MLVAFNMNLCYRRIHPPEFNIFRALQLKVADEFKYPGFMYLLPQKISVSAVGHGKNRPDISICSIPSIRIGSQKRTNLFDSKNATPPSLTF